MTYNRREKKREWAKENLQNAILAVYSIPNPKLGNIGFWARYRFLNRRQCFVLRTAILEIVSD
jgi:hypothetical protein